MVRFGDAVSGRAKQTSRERRHSNECALRSVRESPAQLRKLATSFARLTPALVVRTHGARRNEMWLCRSSATHCSQSLCRISSLLRIAIACTRTLSRILNSPCVRTTMCADWRLAGVVLHEGEGTVRRRGRVSGTGPREPLLPSLTCSPQPQARKLKARIVYVSATDGLGVRFSNNVRLQQRQRFFCVTSPPW